MQPLETLFSPRRRTWLLATVLALTFLTSWSSVNRLRELVDSDEAAEDIAQRSLFSLAERNVLEHLPQRGTTGMALPRRALPAPIWAWKRAAAREGAALLDWAAGGQASLPRTQGSTQDLVQGAPDADAKPAAKAAVRSEAKGAGATSQAKEQLAPETVFKTPNGKQARVMRNTE
jgi:hypothetical protein